MTPRLRSAKKKGWPEHLYERDGYFSWRHPKTGVEYGIGRNQRRAFDQAIKANLHVKGEAPTLDLVQRIEGIGNTWHGWMAAYEKILAKRTLSAKTRVNYASLWRRALRLTDDSAAFDSVTTQVLAKAFAAMEEEGKARTAQSFRSFLKDLFNTACEEGWATENPVLVTRAKEVTVKRARLTFDVFMRVYEREQTTWAKNAYALALLSGQPRQVCSDGQFKDVHDDHWWIRRSKTNAMICIPLDIRLNCFGMSLGDVVKHCRSTGVLSRYLIHQTQTYGNSPIGSKIRLDTLTSHFKETLASLEIDWNGKDPPSLHEIRSLSGRLHKEQGEVNTQQLFGHKNAQTTELYQDARGAEYVKVTINRRTV